MLRAIDQDIWVAEQPFRYFGLSVGNRMTVVRSQNQELIVISPIQVDDATVNQLNQLGIVSHIIAPNLYHHLFVADFKAFYPDATVWAVPGLREKCPDLPIDQIISSGINPAWSGLKYIQFDGFKTLTLNGFDDLNEYIFFHPVSRTLILTDAAFHFDEQFPFVTQLAARVVGGYQQLRPSLLEQIATSKKDIVKQSVKKILDWNFERVIMAHGSIVEQNGRPQFKAGYEAFLGQPLGDVT